MGKKRITKKFIIFIIFTIIFMLIGGVKIFMVLSNPLRRAEEKIKSDILIITPIGTSIEEVVKAVEGKDKWEIGQLRNFGYSMRDGRPSDGSNGGLQIGEKSFRALIGSYLNIQKVTVVVYWGFDENDELINVAVGKEVDAT